VLEYEVIDRASMPALYLIPRPSPTRRRRLIPPTSSYSLLKIRLETGRPHQIRAQISAIGHPIVGDVKYGAPLPRSLGYSGQVGQAECHSLALCATSLKFQLATKDEVKEIEISIPEDWSSI